jgi:tetratricopeptide (TPR) repeat protein
MSNQREERSLVTRIAVVLITLAIISPLLADQGHNHDDPSDQQLGAVHFPISCAPRVQKTFERGVALLHSFAFDTAESTFKQVAEEDPTCAMAYWGIAKTYDRWGEPDKNQLEHGWQAINRAVSLQAKTNREREYIAALRAFYEGPDQQDGKRGDRYLEGMQRLYTDYPYDHEAAAFYAFALKNADRDDDPTHAKRKQAAAILEKLFAIEPNHPGVAHYLIHTYDYAGMAELGLPAARRYAKIAPAAPHALHMPSHIFARLGMWQEDIDSNLASIAASRNAAATHMGDVGHQYHAMEFLIYAYLQTGRDAEAAKLIEEVRSLPKMKDMYGSGFDPQISALTSFSAFYSLELHHWKEAEALPLISPADDADASITYKARAIGAARNGDLATARSNLQSTEQLHATLVKEKKLPLSINAVEHDRRIVTAWIDHAEGRNKDAIEILRDFAAKEQGTFAPDGGIPAHEMLGDIFVDLGKPEQALVEYEAELKLSPNRFNSLFGAGHAAELSHQPAKAAVLYEQLLNICAGGNSTRPEIGHARSFLSTNGITPQSVSHTIRSN